jgi:hypothetical protein
MVFRRRLAAFAPVIAALAVGGPVASASPATAAPTEPVVTGPSCPDGYSGPINLATGCPYYLMSYTVQYPGQPSFRCPVNWSQALASPGVDAVAGCGGLFTAK